MKIVIAIILLSLITITPGTAQKTYNVTGMAANLSIPPVLTIKIYDVNATVVISESFMDFEAGGKTTSYAIVKKVNENYFKVRDGLKEYVITITNGSPGLKKYSGCITQENDKGIIYMWYK